MLGTASSGEASRAGRLALARVAPILLLSVALWATAVVAAGAATTDTGASRAEALKDLQRILHSRSGGAAGGSAGATGPSTAPKRSAAPGAGSSAGAPSASGAPTTQGATSAATTTTTTTTSSVTALSSLTLSSTAAAHSHAAGSTTSTPAIVLAAIAAALLLLSLIWALARALAYEPSWMPVLRHSFAEAGFRLSGTFAELRDWLRLGR
jgi:hypothetical protein